MCDRDGGVRVLGNIALKNLCWHFPFPADIVRELHTDANPEGRLTIYDLELVAAFVHFSVLVMNTPMRDRSSTVFLDNTPTMSWCTKMNDKSISPVAGRLLRKFSMLQRRLLSAPVMLTHVPGEDNKMAEFNSRS